MTAATAPDHRRRTPRAAPDALIRLSSRLADEARVILRRRFRTGVAVRRKEDGSPVTDADLEVETRLRAMIAEAAPQCGVLGEEAPPHKRDAPWVFTLDPIDGTSGFISGKPLFGVLIGLARYGKPVFGVIEHPATEERWQGGAGAGNATLNGVSCHTAARGGLEDAVLYASSPHMFKERYAPAFAALSARAAHTLYGADCYAYGLLASGFVDVVAEASMKTCDFCALAPVVEAAGGVVSDWQGRPLDFTSDGTVLATAGPALHQQALATLAAGAP